MYSPPLVSSVTIFGEEGLEDIDGFAVNMHSSNHIPIAGHNCPSQQPVNTYIQSLLNSKPTCLWTSSLLKSQVFTLYTLNHVASCDISAA